MPRRKLNPNPIAGITIDSHAVSTAVAVVDELGHLDVDAQAKTAKLAERLHYDGPLDPDILQFTASENMRQSVWSWLKTGVALLLLKERVPHGEFQRRLGLIDIAPRAAQKLMACALKFNQRPATVEAAANATKLIELLMLEEQDLDQLEGEGSALDITLDDLARLSKHELRKHLREAKQSIEAQQKLIEAKNKKIDELVVTRHREAADEAVAVEQRIGAWQDAVRRLFVEIRKAENVARACTSDDTGLRVSCEMQLKQGIEFVVAQLRELVVELDIDVDSDVSPKIPDFILSAEFQAHLKAEESRDATEQSA